MSEADRGGRSRDIPYMWNLKRNPTDELNYKAKRDSQTQRMNSRLPGSVGIKTDRELGMDMDTLHGSPARACCTAPATLLRATRQPAGRGIRRTVDACVRTAESLHCSHETIVRLLAGSTPVQNKSLKKRSRLQCTRHGFDP